MLGAFDRNVGIIEGVNDGAPDGRTVSTFTGMFDGEWECSSVGFKLDLEDGMLE